MPTSRTATAPTIDLWRRFNPTPSQLKFLRSKARGRCFSSGYGSGKSKTGCRESINWAVRFPGSRNLVGRLTATDLRDTTQVTFWREMAEIGFVKGQHYEFNRSTNALTWWNGSETIFRHLDDPLALGSLELSSCFVDEGSEVTDAVLSMIYSSRLRWHLPSCTAAEIVSEMIQRGAPDSEVLTVGCECPHGMWTCTNPGASGFLRAVTRGEVDGWEWIKASPGDNPYNGPDYYAQMERLRKVNGEVWMKRYYEGSWDVFEGARFPMFDRDRHVMVAAWRPTGEHEVIESWDFGHRETFVVWSAYHPRRNEPVVVFHELQMNEVMEPKDVADEVKRIRAQYKLDERRMIVLGDPAGVASSQFSAVSPIAAYAGLGIHIAPCKAGKSPTARADLLTAFLTDKRLQPDGSVWPGIVFGSNCPAVVDSIINLRWKPQVSRVGEDPREQFLKKDDHGFDALGYGLVVVPPPDLTVRKITLPPGVNGRIEDVLTR